MSPVNNLPTSPTSISESTIHHNLSIEYDHLNATAISVEESGSYAVLAGRKGLYLIDLESPFHPSRVLHHQSRWDVGVVTCNPHHMYKGYIASTSNRNALIWNVGSDGNASQPLTATLRAHTRPLSDISWSPLEASTLATCSADACHIWDVRTPSTPVLTLKTFASSATQVEWNRFDQSSLATAHDKDVKIWDTRFAEKTPLTSITAHMQSIYGIDWSPNRVYELITCSEDRTVKIWNVTAPRVCQGSLKTGAPVWRAKYTPFGDGIVTVSHRLDNTLRLWSLAHAKTLSGPAAAQGPAVSAPMAPAVQPVPGGAGTNTVAADQIHAFHGHDDVVRCFDWRKRDSDTYQLISWSKRQELRMWKVEPLQLEACGHISSKEKKPARKMHEDSHGNDSTILSNFSKFDVSYLKNDFTPVKPPRGAKQVSMEMFNSNKCTGSGTEISNDAPRSDEKLRRELRNDYETTNFDASSGQKDEFDSVLAAPRMRKTGPIMNTRLPCARISGACFNGANVLVKFTSYAAVGQQLNQEGKYVPPLPKTYAGLLEMKKQAGRTGVVEDSRNYSMLKHAASRLGYQVSGGSPVISRTPPFLRPSGREGLNFGSPVASSPLQYDESFPDYEDGRAMHGSSPGYLSSYFDSSLHHLPINDPDHLLASEKGLVADSDTSQRAFAINVILIDMSKMCASDMKIGLEYNYSLKKSSLRPATVSTAKISSCPFQKTRRPEIGNFGSRTLSATELANALSRFRPSPTKKADLPPLPRLPLKRSSSSTDLLSPQKTTVQSATIIAASASASVAAEPKREESTHDVENLHLASATKHSVSDVCRHNGYVAAKYGAEDISRIWNVLSQVCNDDVVNPKHELLDHRLHPWTHHPLGRPLVEKILKLQEKEADTQSLASIVAVVGSQLRRKAQGKHNAPTKKSSDNSLAAKKTLKGHAAASSPDIVREYANQVVGAPPARSSSYVDFETIGSSVKTWSVGSSQQQQRQQHHRQQQQQQSAKRALTQDLYHTPPKSVKNKQDVDSASGDTEARLEELATTHVRKDTINGHGNSGKKRARRPSVIITLQELIHPCTSSSLAYTLSAVDESRLLLDPAPDTQKRYDTYIRQYADVLYRWGATSTRAEIMKCLYEADEEHKGLSLAKVCGTCRFPVDGLQCNRCNDFAVRCSLCQLVVRGLSMFCFTCGHGGHSAHIRSWFAAQKSCPTGCGCRCKFATSTTLTQQPVQLGETAHTIQS